jgi:tetratricopeptide (TPR) repeat protein
VLALFRQLGDTWGIYETGCRLALERLAQGDFVRAGELLDEGIRLAGQAEDKIDLAWLLMWSSFKNLHQGITDRRTERTLQQSLALFGEVRHKKGVAVALHFSGKSAYLLGEDERARAFFEKSLRLGQQIGLKWNVAQCLTNLAELFCSHGEPERGARLLGAVSDLAQILFAGSGIIAKDGRTDTERSLTAASALLGEAGFAVAYAEGQMMTLDRAIAYALDNANYVETE